MLPLLFISITIFPNILRKIWRGIRIPVKQIDLIKLISGLRKYSTTIIPERMIIDTAVIFFIITTVFRILTPFGLIALFFDLFFLIDIRIIPQNGSSIQQIKLATFNNKIESSSIFHLLSSKIVNNYNYYHKKTQSTKIQP